MTIDKNAFDGPAVAAALKSCGVSHVVWVPDSLIGTWEGALAAEPALQLVRACREGEALGIAAGLWLGGQQPLVCIQCTGLFEAGDALRNLIHDLHLPLFLFIGVRGYYAHQQGKTGDTCPLFTEPIMRAWQVPYVVFDRRHTPADLAAEYQKAREARRAGAVLWAE
jgi:sulfopyruvate decarboxylase TPP-binding subunit